MNIKIRHFLFFLVPAVLIISSCKSTPDTIPADLEQTGNAEAEQPVSGLADEIRNLVEKGDLPSLTDAQNLIQSRNLGDSEFGRVMNGIISVLLKNVYPDSLVQPPMQDLPQTHNYTYILKEAETGNYIPPQEGSTDFFEYILPFFSIKDASNPEILSSALQDLQKAGEIRPDSVLPPYFQGLIFEKQSKLPEAEAAFQKAYAISADFYPAQSALARILALSGKNQESTAIISDLVINYPDNINIKKQLAVSYYNSKDWSRAGPAIDEILQQNPSEEDFLLMKAHILIEQGSFSQAAAPLDTYASLNAANANNRDYLFLRARLQAEGNRNRDSALNYLRSILRSNPNDNEAVIYAARLLMESQRPADQSEGRELLARLRQTTDSSMEVLSLSLQDSVRRENWQEAQGFLNRILASRRTPQDLIDAYYIERGLRNNARALTFASELYQRDTFNNDYIAVYVSALIDNGRRDEASALLQSRLSSLGEGAERARFYFLRSRLQTNEEDILSDLRSCLFEDPRNLDGLIAMFEFYHRRREERRAVNYLRQALAISPENPRLKRYENEYSALLSR